MEEKKTQASPKSKAWKAGITETGNYNYGGHSSLMCRTILYRPANEDAIRGIR